jgi:hypothetical protein
LSDGAVDIEMAETIAIYAIYRYHTTEKNARLAYAKTDEIPIAIV